MRSDRYSSWLLLSLTLLAGAAACSHAPLKPEDEGAAVDGGATPTVSDTTPEVAPVPHAGDQGAKLSAKEDDTPAAAAQSGSPAVRAAFAQAMQEALKGDNDTAIGSLHKALSNDPSLYWAHYDLGALAERKQRYEDALSEYHKALDLKPDFGSAAMAMARLMARLKRLPEVESDLRSRISQHPSALGLRNALVFALVQDGMLDGAATEAKKVLKADERNTGAMFQLATIYYKQGKNELSLMVLDNCKAIRPEDALVYNALGFVHIALGEKPQALEDFKAAASLSPDFAEAHNNLGALLNEAQDYSGAVKELQEAVRDAPDFAAARLNLGNAYRGDKQYDRALAEYQKVLQLNPQYRDALFNLGVLYFDGDFPQMSPVDRLHKAEAYLDQYRSAGGEDSRVDQYKKDAEKLIEKERRKQERQEKDKLRKAQQDAAKASKDAAKAAASPGGTKLNSKDDDSPAPAPRPKAKLAPASHSSGTKLNSKEDDSPAPNLAPQSDKLGGGDEK